MLLTVVTIGLAIAGYYFKESEAGDASSSDQVTEESSSKSDKVKSKSVQADDKRKPVTTSKADGMLKVARVTDSTFTSLKGSRLDTSHYGNDGDSFKVKHKDGVTEFRLYYVDTAESKYKEYRDGNNNGKRLDEQGAYFGGIDREKTAKVGSVAKAYVLKLLEKAPFTVATKWENVYGPDRKYCFVIVDFEGEKRYLHEILVAKGLARIHTKPSPLPDSTSSSRQRSHLKAMEAEAKAAGVGAWSLTK